MSDNPYESPKTLSKASRLSYEKLTVTLVWLLIVVLATGAIVQLACSFAQAWVDAAKPINDFLMPRFGWIGLVLGSNVMIGLAMWLRSRKRGAFGHAIFMAITVATLNAWQIISSGTTAVVENPFLDRLHSSWAWAVASYAAIAILIAWLWWLQPAARQETAVAKSPEKN